MMEILQTFINQISLTGSLEGYSCSDEHRNQERIGYAMFISLFAVGGFYAPLVSS